MKTNETPVYGRPQLAEEAGLLPWQVSFMRTLQAVNAFAAVLWTGAAEELAGILRRLREALRGQPVGERPNRSEPRVRKRRPKPYLLLNEPQQKARARLGITSCS